MTNSDGADELSFSGSSDSAFLLEAAIVILFEQ